ncbi:DoxX family protein [Piscinibacterium candidicorallinum]|uniref:DoxX family protein n=1 Tax=Piscinibacterium candidicorallinum TaxID=1793872 RepID=A0ABV7H3C8_9BURK
MNTLAQMRSNPFLSPLGKLLSNIEPWAQSVFLLGLRLYVANVFFLAGLTKIRDWETTLLLFTEEYKVPLLPPDIAAVFGTGGELVLPVLLALGLAGRFGAAGLFVMNIVAVVSYPGIAPAALQGHVTWGVMLATVALFGSGKLSIDWTVCKAVWQRIGLKQTRAAV